VLRDEMLERCGTLRRGTARPGDSFGLVPVLNRSPAILAVKLNTCYVYSSKRARNGEYSR
jgi:hypothetical protein